MSIRYNYIVVRYSPDPGAGEMLNVGVVLHLPDQNIVHWRFEEKFERLSFAFAGFHGASYRRSLLAVRGALKALGAEHEGTALFQGTTITSLADHLHKVIADDSLSLRMGKVFAGITTQPDFEVEYLFQRMVTDRFDAGPPNQRRSDEQVWNSVYAPALPKDVTDKLQAVTIRSGECEVEFPHAYKNGRWHVVQPISLDYKRGDAIKRRSNEWVGAAAGLEESNELARIYFLLGAPSDPQHWEAYEKAKRHMHRMAVAHEIVEESDAAAFAQRLSQIVHDSDH